MYLYVVINPMDDRNNQELVLEKLQNVVYNMGITEHYYE
jgi:hypothetical protein